MPTLYFISHPEVTVDFNVPIERWDLSAKGRERLGALLTQPWLKNVHHLFSSNETKAKTTARAISKKLGVKNQVLMALGEMDRSSTGAMPLDQFNTLVDEFFANPTLSVRGWERGIDAQARIIRAIKSIIHQCNNPGDIVVVSHGGVGALLLSYLKSAPISRSEDQPGQGHYFAINTDTMGLIHQWRPIDAQHTD